MHPALADRLDLNPHPEGGWYRQTWVSPASVVLPDGRERPTATLIHFLLPAGESSAWHRVVSDEVWLAHTGTVALELGGDGPAPEVGAVQTIALGAELAPGEVAQAVVPAHVWQRTLPGPVDALVSCLVSPGFDFADFELAPGQRAEDGDTSGDGDGGGPSTDTEVPRAPAGPEDAPVDPDEPTNPA
jgi:predicted cupin superfamily sugar epimerase